MRLVYDTNIVISALLFEGSKPAKAFDIGIKQGSILFSLSTFAELEEVLRSMDLPNTNSMPPFPKRLHTQAVI